VARGRWLRRRVGRSSDGSRRLAAKLGGGAREQVERPGVVAVDACGGRRLASSRPWTVRDRGNSYRCSPVRRGKRGDCGAWLIAENGIEELTADQVRKPLLGSGEAVPIAFESALGGATLLLATDGLFK